MTRIVGFATVGHARGGTEQRRHGEVSTEAGMRITDKIPTAPAHALEDRRHAGKREDLDALPRASERSTHARIACNGKVARA